MLQEQSGCIGCEEGFGGLVKFVSDHFYLPKERTNVRFRLLPRKIGHSRLSGLVDCPRADDLTHPPPLDRGIGKVLLAYWKRIVETFFANRSESA